MPESDHYDYVIVGSGAGGGTLAARLAENGKRVCLLEAGGDPLWGRVSPTLPEDYEVPSFHPFASENPTMSWDCFVSHYTSEEQQRRDPKFVEGKGIFYPRAATLGGCTAHNAMIYLYPHDSDWDDIAKLTGDKSWRASEMQKYAKRVEDCRHRPFWRLMHWFGLDRTGHGWKGWLPTEKAIPAQAITDCKLVWLVLGTVAAEVFGRPGWPARLWRLIRFKADPNDRRWLRKRRAGPCYTPLSTRHHRRVGVRERVLDIARCHPERLHIEYDALATRVLFADKPLANGEFRAIGVEYLEGEKLYRAHPTARDAKAEARRVYATREVILAGGAFNTPQLLMLSGIGPEDEFERPELQGLQPLVHLPGVGRNLQDRYEVSVVHKATGPWKSLRGARFEKGDPLYRQWADFGKGFYGSNGVAVAFSMRSEPEDPGDPDLFCIGLLGLFTGYFPGYSREIPKHLDTLSFTLLKAHTENRIGSVTLRSTDPRHPPAVNFRYFNDGRDRDGKDLRAVVQGIRAIRGIVSGLKKKGILCAEELPGEDLASGEQLKEFVRDNAWGHHASCTCAIGPREDNGVLSSRLEVHGTRGLRVVDASVFPKIPGFFIASAIFMVAEKAADMILRDAETAGS